VLLAVSQFAVGWAQAGLVPITSLAVKNWFPASRRGVPSAVIASAMSAGGIGAMAITGALLVRIGDWQRVFLIYAGLGLAWSLVFYWLYRSKPAEHPWVNAAEAALIDEEEPPPPQPEEIGADAPVLAPRRSDVARRMIGSASLWALAAQWFCRSAGYQFFARWFPAFLQDRFGMAVDQAGYYSSWPLFGVVVGSLAGGYLVDVTFRRTASRWKSRNLISMVSLLLCAACLAASGASETGARFVALMAAGAFFSGISMPTGWAANIDIAGRETALLFAVTNMAATAAGIVSPPIVGALMTRIAESGGDYGTVIYLHAAVHVAAAALWLSIDTNRTID
jgi:sugar phosphate permease